MGTLCQRLRQSCVVQKAKFHRRQSTRTWGKDHFTAFAFQDQRFSIEDNPDLPPEVFTLTAKKSISTRTASARLYPALLQLLVGGYLSHIDQIADLNALS